MNFVFHIYYSPYHEDIICIIQEVLMNEQSWFMLLSLSSSFIGPNACNYTILDTVETQTMAKSGENELVEGYFMSLKTDDHNFMYCRSRRSQMMCLCYTHSSLISSHIFSRCSNWIESIIYFFFITTLLLRMSDCWLLWAAHRMLKIYLCV